MKLLYSRFRISLFAFTLGLAAVYMWNGLSIGWMEIPVDLPKISSEVEVLTVFPTAEPAFFIGHHYEDRTEQILDGRALSVYDTMAYVEECSIQEGNDLKKCLANRDAVRKFVYKHWTQQRSGYVQIGLPCVDCAPVDHIFIEPDENGRWVMVTTLETSGPLSTSRSVKAVFRKSNREEKRYYRSPRILSLIDQNGREVEAF